MAIKITSKPFVIGATAFAAAAGMSGYLWHEKHRPPILEIYVFSLKSGRAMLVRTPEDRRILIDGGGNSEIIRNMTNILPFYSRHIDTIIATGSDGKNVSGLIDVINRYNIDQAYIPALTINSLGISSTTDQIYPVFLEKLLEKKIPARELMAGDSISFDSMVNARVLFPLPEAAFSYSNASAPELLLGISFKSTSAMFMGNASKKIQKVMASTAIDHTDVLITSNSAASENMSQELIDKFKPGYLIYSKAINRSVGQTSKLLVKSSKASKANSSSKKKAASDPFAGILDENRFNTKEETVKIVSDGLNLTIQ